MLLIGVDYNYHDPIERIAISNFALSCTVTLYSTIEWIPNAAHIESPDRPGSAGRGSKTAFEGLIAITADNAAELLADA